MHSPGGVGPLDGGQGNVEVLGEEPAFRYQEIATLRVIGTQRADLHTGGVIHGRARDELLLLHLFYPLTTIEPSTVRSLICPSPTTWGTATGVITPCTAQGPASDAPFWRRPRVDGLPDSVPGGKVPSRDPTRSSVAPV